MIPVNAIQFAAYGARARLTHKQFPPSASSAPFTLVEIEIFTNASDELPLARAVVFLPYGTRLDTDDASNASNAHQPRPPSEMDAAIQARDDAAHLSTINAVI